MTIGYEHVIEKLRLAVRTGIPIQHGPTAGASAITEVKTRAFEEDHVFDARSFDGAVSRPFDWSTIDTTTLLCEFDAPDGDPKLVAELRVLLRKRGVGLV